MPDVRTSFDEELFWDTNARPNREPRVVVKPPRLEQNPPEPKHELTEPERSPEPHQQPTTDADEELAFRARKAGKYLASRLGRTKPFSPHQIWALARYGKIPVTHLGRNMYFQRDALDAFISAGGTAKAKR